LCERRTNSFHRGVEQPPKRHLRPRVVLQLVLQTLAVTMSMLPRWLPSRERGDITCAWTIEPCTSRMIWSLTPPVTPPSWPSQGPPTLPTSRIHSTSDEPTPLLSRPEAPSTNESHSNHDPCWRLSHDLLGRHWCLGFAASTQLPTCLHPQVLQTRPSNPMESAGHMPFVSFYNVVIHEHDRRSLRPHRADDASIV
jgi:hypothetical protein